MTIDQLPRDFPRDVTVTLRQGQHNGQPQFWTPFNHGGKTYKLVVTNERGSKHVLRAGETWAVYTRNSPNGHIVFCVPHRQLQTAAGKHPAVERAKRHIEGGHGVFIDRMVDRRSRDVGWKKRGYLIDVLENDGMLKIIVGEATLFSKTPGVRPLHIEPFSFEVPAAEAIWNESDRHGDETLTFVDLDEEAHYTVVFSNNSYQGVELGEDEDEDADDDGGAYDEHRARQDERFYEDDPCEGREDLSFERDDF